MKMLSKLICSAVLVIAPFAASSQAFADEMMCPYGPDIPASTNGCYCPCYPGL